MAKYLNRDVSIVSITFEEPQVKIQNVDGSMETVDLGSLILEKDEMGRAFKDLKDWHMGLDKRNAVKLEKNVHENLVNEGKQPEKVKPAHVAKTVTPVAPNQLQTVRK